MSNEERARRNLPRFSWEVTIADVVQLLVLVAMAVKLYDQVQVHETRLADNESRIKMLTDSGNDYDRRLSVLEDRQLRFKSQESDARIGESHGNGGK